MNTNTLTILISSVNAHTQFCSGRISLSLYEHFHHIVQYKGVLFGHHNFDKDVNDQ